MSNKWRPGGIRVEGLLGIWVLGLGTGCGARCDLELLQSEWYGLGDSPSIEETLGLLSQTCPAAPEALIGAAAQSQLEALHPVLGCAGPEQSMTTTGDVSQIQVREALWEECEVEAMDLGSRRAFLWSTGRPEIAVALARFLGEQEAPADLTQAMVASTLASSMLPLDEDYEPLVLGKRAQSTVEPATERLVGGAGARLVPNKGDGLSALAAGLQEHGELTLVGLAADGQGFAELQLKRDETEAIFAPDQLSIWVHPGHGLTLFQGEELLGTDEACPQYSICQGEGEAMDLEALASIASASVPEGGLRLGLIEGDLALSGLNQIIDIVGAESPVLVQISSLPEAVPTDPELTATARWIAGMPDHYGVLDSALRENRVWKSHQSWLDERWDSYDERHLSQIRNWMPDNLGDLTDLPLFYPFSGPDILNAVTFFPGQDLYVMGGLEAIGQIPQVPDTLDSNGSNGLAALRQSLHNYLARNYFITWQMLGTRDFKEYTRLGAYEYNGTAALMMVFLVRTGHDLISVRRVTLDDSGAVVDADSLKGGPRAVEIRFRESSSVIPSPEPEQALIFFSGDLSDRKMSTTRGYVPFVEGLGQFNTFLKAASYLMHNKSFDDVRSAILGRSRHIVMEASGVPYHFLKSDTENWSVRLYGAYTEPIGDFTERCQPDLLADIAEKNLGSLPFRFGYHGRNFHMIVGERVTPIVPIHTDGDRSRGIDTVYRRRGDSCIGGTHLIREVE